MSLTGGGNNEVDKKIAKAFTTQLMRDIAKDITEALDNEGLGFCLLVFPFGEAGISNYISNCHRDDMIKALREAADRLEDNKDKG